VDEPSTNLKKWHVLMKSPLEQSYFVPPSWLSSSVFSKVTLKAARKKYENGIFSRIRKCTQMVWALTRSQSDFLIFVHILPIHPPSIKFAPPSPVEFVISGNSWINNFHGIFSKRGGVHGSEKNVANFPRNSIKKHGECMIHCCSTTNRPHIKLPLSAYASLGEKQRERGGNKNENLNNHMTVWKKKMKAWNMTTTKDFITKKIYFFEGTNCRSGWEPDGTPKKIATKSIALATRNGMVRDM